jgi:hypothetical protein
MLGVLAAVACGGGGGDDMQDIDATPPEPDASCMSLPDGGSGPAAGEVGGTWARLQLTTVRVQGFNPPQIARNVYLDEQVQNGTALTITETLCALQIDDTAELVYTRVLPSFLNALPPEARTGSIVPDGAGGFQFLMDKDFVTRGVTLVDQENDPLPTDPLDPQIGDWDMDSQPGMTLLLMGVLQGKAYVIQRDWSQLDGTQVHADRVTGLVVWDTEQIYLGSDPTAIADLNATPSPDTDPSKHTFVSVRIPPGSDCAYVVAHQCDLFGR